MITVYSEETRARIAQRSLELEELNKERVLTFKDFTVFDIATELIDNRLLSLYRNLVRRLQLPKLTNEIYAKFVEEFDSFKVLVIHDKKRYLVRTNFNAYLKSVKPTASAVRLATLKDSFGIDFSVVDKIEDVSGAVPIKKVAPEPATSAGVLSEKEIKDFYSNFNDFFKTDYKDDFDKNWTRKISARKDAYDVTYKGKIIGNTETTAYNIQEPAFYNIIINFILSNANLQKKMKVVLDRQAKAKELLAGIKEENEKHQTELKNVLSEAFVEFDDDNSVKTEFKVKYSQVGEWEWWNKQRPYSDNPIELDTMFEVVSVSIESKFIGTEPKFEGNKFYQTQKIFEWNSIHFKLFSERVSFILDYLGHNIVYCNCHYIDTNRPITSLSYTFDFISTKVEPIERSHYGYQNLKFKENPS